MTKNDEGGSYTINIFCSVVLFFSIMLNMFLTQGGIETIINNIKSKRPVSVAYEKVVVMPEIKKADTFLAECTAYTAGYESTGKRPGDTGYGITSSGKRVRVGYVAADINVLPYGTLIYIDGMGVYEVQDTGNAIKGNKIDIFYENVKDALNFGRQSKRVIVLHKG